MALDGDGGREGGRETGGSHAQALLLRRLVLKNAALTLLLSYSALGVAARAPLSQRSRVTLSHLTLEFAAQACFCATWHLGVCGSGAASAPHSATLWHSQLRPKMRPEASVLCYTGLCFTLSCAWICMSSHESISTVGRRAPPVPFASQTGSCCGHLSHGAAVQDALFCMCLGQVSEICASRRQGRCRPERTRASRPGTARKPAMGAPPDLRQAQPPCGWVQVPSQVRIAGASSDTNIHMYMDCCASIPEF